ncbi:MAG TPA: cupin domain-containing protein [Candidatus Limiplasma sp.]|nr:cupin domain-containing protein [Candidatus Limiplasma sp.]HRX09124.1 cupin domain-containing protein [Candidatus Limiplasma sp.]
MTVQKASGVKWTDLGSGVRRRVLAHTKDIMVVEVAFDKGGVGSPHSHPHAQCTYVQSGTFVFTGGSENYTVSAGDSLAFERNETHGCVCTAEGTLIDVFSPQREDFLS